MYERVFAEGKIGSVTMKNRFVVPAMGSQLLEYDGSVNDRYIDYWVERAKGGFGLIITEYTGVSADGAANPFELMIHKDSYIPGLKRLTEAVHQYGAKIFCQLHHAGREGSSQFTQLPLVAASAIPCPHTKDLVREMSTEYVYEMIQRFIDGACRAKEAGFDGVEIHGAHGYLVANFLSPYSNKRTDEFGGTITNRARFAVNIVKGIKERCGADFPVSFRISAVERVDGGIDLNEAKVICRMLEAAGIDALNVNNATYGSWPYLISSYHLKPGINLELVRELRKVVKVPIITVGRFSDPAFIDSTLADGDVDFIAMGRQSLADPHYPEKLKEGREAEILPCVACMSRCQRIRGIYGQMDYAVSCMVNPFCGHESTMKIEQSANPKNVVIVGAGPGGLAAAWVAAACGHKVTVLEKAPTFGGQILYASMPPSKHDLNHALQAYAALGKKYGVDYRYNTEATADMVLGLKPDAVILATGGVPVEPAIPAEDGVETVRAIDILGGKVLAGNKVLVIGGGLVGLETAEYLVAQNRKASVIEMTGSTDGKMDESVKYFSYELLERGKVDINVNTKVEKLTVDGAVCSTPEGERVFKGYDQLVIALGSKTYNPLEKELEGKVPVQVIGDAKEAKRLMLNAVHEAVAAALSLN